MIKNSSSYVGAVYDYDSDKVMVWERDGAQRKIRAFDPPRYFYVKDKNGTFKSIYGDPLTKLVFDNASEFNVALREYAEKFESDIPPLFKVLMDEYYNSPTPQIHYAFIDIEVDYKSTLGFSSPENPYAPINAVTIYQSWTKRYLTYAVPPKDWDGVLPTAEQQKQLGFSFTMDLVICKDEKELLSYLVRDIQDADIISGWNSEFFDLPYIIKRLERISPKLTQKLCFTGCRPPKEKTVERFGAEQIVYVLNGRTHLDYLDLFKKFTFEGRTSYSLANIANDELSIPKLDYEGTLEQLYNRDFAWFCLYNARDVEVLVKLDEKFKFIQMVNQMAHENTCLFGDMLGTVRYVETGITNRAHNVHGLIVADKKMMTDGEKVEGALVLSPLVGLHRWLGSVDINSLYPSVIRALNISPEKFVGQFVSGANHSPAKFETAGEADWRGIIEGDDLIHILRTDDGETFEGTGLEWQTILKEQKWVITAFGTVFDESSGLGIVADALTFWYDERKRLQAEKKKWGKELERLVSTGVKENSGSLVKHEDLFYDQVTIDKIIEATKQEEHYDLLQLTKKIQLNSTYGALLSPFFRLGRKEMGASVTATGRQITTFMIESIGELVTGKETKVEKKSFINNDGEINHVYTTNSDVILLSDTDSCYFKTNADNKEDAIEIADTVAKEVNSYFPQFMREKFYCQEGHDNLIKAGREIVGSAGLFLNAKKKYTIKVVDNEGKSVNKLKTVGSEMKKADTPKVIQDFLKELMELILDSKPYDVVEKFVNESRKKLVFKVENPVVLGTAKQINNFDSFYAEYQRTEKVGKGKMARCPGHVRAAINYNELALEHEVGPKLIKAGDKGIVFYVKPNPYNIKSIAFPADISKFPDWFNEHFKLDRKLTEEKLVDNKLERIFEAMQWEIPTPQNSRVNSIIRF